MSVKGANGGILGISPKAAVCIVYVAAMFISAMDTTVVNVALRSIGLDLGVSPSATGTLNSGYMVSLAVLLPAAGWMGDKWGTKRTFLSAIALFTLASVMCGMAQTLNQLTFFRILQGIGGGVLTPVGMTLLFRTFPPEERASVSRQLILPIALAPALGPIIGGAITEYLSWRWIFWINLPIGLFALVIGALALQEYRESGTGALDKKGFLLSAAAMGLIVYASGQGAQYGWNTPSAQYTGLAALLLLGLLVITELRADKPLLDLRLAGDRLFGTMCLLSLLSAAAIHGMLYVFPLMYQEALGASALQSGLTTFPEALGLMVASQVVPWSYRVLKPRRLIALTLAATMGIFIALSFTSHQTDPWVTRLLMFGIGFFLGQTVGAIPIAAFANISPAAMGRATTLFTVQNRLGSVLGLSIMASLLSLGPASSEAAGITEAAAEPYRFAIRIAVLFLIIGLAAMLRFRDEDVAATWKKRVKSAVSVMDKAPTGKQSANPAGNKQAEPVSMKQSAN